MSALLIFAIALGVKIITLPLIYMAQKNAIRLLLLQPELDHIKRAHYGDKERINEEQYLLYKREKYNPLSGIIPLLSQLVLLVVVVQILYRLDLEIDINLGLLAAMSGGSSYILCLVQNGLNPAQRRMRFWGKWGMSIVIIAFSAYFPLVMPSSVGLYWTFGNILGVAVALVINVLYNPKKHAPAELLAPPRKLSREERLALRERKAKLSALENESVKRFYAHADKDKLMFYSVSGGQYKYFSELIDYILANSDLVIHYVTNDPEDKQLKSSRVHFETYYIGEKKAITFMLNLHTVRMVIMTAPNLQQFHIKRSIVDMNIEYVFTWHHFTSLIILREGALDHFDTVLCVGSHQIEEIRKTEQFYGLPEKRLVKCGYGQIDKLLRMYADMPKREVDKPQILIAPSWSGGNILDSCLDQLVKQLVDSYTVIVRPHPEYIRRFTKKWQAIKDKYDNVVFDEDFLSNTSIYQSDVLITDWSNVAYEFSYCTKRPTIYINTPQKIMNSEYYKLGVEPLDVTLRNTLGVSIDTDKLDMLPDVVVDMLCNQDKYRDRINEAIEPYLFYPGESGEAGGRYVISRFIQS